MSAITIGFTAPVFAANEGTISGTVSSYDIPQSNETENKFQSLTENDPLSIITINNRSFKKYQDLAYMLKYDWFTSGLFGLKLTYGIDDSGKPMFWFENRLPSEIGAINNISINAVDMTTNRTIYIGQTPSEKTVYIPVSTPETAMEGTMSNIIGLDNPVNDINNDIYVTSVSFNYLLHDDNTGYDVNVNVLYDFDNGTYTTTSSLFDVSHSETNPLTYDVLKSK